NYLDTPYSNQKFWVARAARILPVYWLALAVDLPTAILSASKRGIHFFPGCFAAPLLLQSWIPSSSLLWNPPGWSLSTEAFFYLAFPFLAPQLAALFRKYPLPTLVLLWLAGAVPSIAYAFLHPEGAINQWSMTFWISVVKFNPLVRLPEFGLGVCLGTAYLDGWRVPRPRICLAVCCLATIGLAVILHPMPYPSLHDGLLAPIFGLMILAIASIKSSSTGSILDLLGEASYSLYILMTPTAAAVHAFFIFIHANPISTAASIVTAVVGISISILSLKLAEIPARSWVRNRLSFAPRREVFAGS